MGHMRMLCGRVHGLFATLRSLLHGHSPVSHDGCSIRILSARPRRDTRGSRDGWASCPAEWLPYAHAGRHTVAPWRDGGTPYAEPFPPAQGACSLGACCGVGRWLMQGRSV